MDPRRLPFLVLVVAVVLGVLSGAAAVMVSVRGEDPAEAVPSTEPGPGVEPSAVRVLRDWDARRARAYARGDLGALAALYVSGSRTGAADLAVLRGYRDRRLRVKGMRTQVLAVHLVRKARDRLLLRVTDVLVHAVATRGRHRWPLPRDRPSTRRVALRRTDDGWQVEDVFVVD